MSLFASLNASHGLEDGDVEINLTMPADDEGNPVDTEESADVIGADTVADAEEVADVADDTEEVAADEEALEGIRLKLKASLATGGLSPDAAQFMQAQVEHICAKYSGGSTVYTGIPSFESFGGRDSRIVSTEASLAAVGNKIREFWAQIVRFVKGLWDKLSGWFTKVTSSAKSYIKKAEAIITQAKALSGKTSSAKTVKVSNIKNLVCDGKVATGSGLSAELKGQAVVVRKFLAADIFNEPTWTSVKAKLDMPSAPVEVLGNMRLSQTGPNAGVHQTAYVGTLPTELDVLTTVEITNIAGAVIVLMTEVSEGQKNYAKVAKAKDHIMKLIDNEVVKAGKDGADASEARTAAVQGRKAVTVIAKISTSSVKAAINGGATALHWCSASINTYEKPGAKAQ